MNAIGTRLMKGSAWLSASRLIVNALSVLNTIVLARWLVPEDFGLVALAMTLLTIVTSITDLSLSMALVRHEAPTRAHFDTAWTLGVLRGIVLGVLLAAAGFPLAAAYGDPRLVAVTGALGFGTFVNGLMNPRGIMLQRNLIFWQEFALNVAQKLAGFIAALAIAYFHRTYWALILGTLATQVTAVIVSYMIMPYRPRLSFSHVKELMSFSIWLTGGQIVNTLNWRFDQLMIGRILGMGALGHYSVGSTLAQTPTTETTTPLVKVVFPAFSNIRDDRTRLATAYQRAQALITAVALPAGFGTALIADPLIRLTMGDKWEPVIFVVQVLAAVFALQTLGSLSQPLGMALGETRLLFMRNLQMLLIRIPLIVAGMLLGGLKGVVLARVVSGLIAIFLAMRLVQRFSGLDLKTQLTANLRALVSVCAMSVGVAAVTPWLGHAADSAALLVKIATLIVVAAVLYCGTSVLLWTIMHRPSGPEQEIQRLLARVVSKLGTA